MTRSVRSLSQSALLIALGIVIPMFMPKIQIEPASYTLASHVPVFISMFLSPSIAIAVVLGTALGFFMTSPAVIALRALSHIVFAYIGSLYLQKKNRKEKVLRDPKLFFKFNLIIAIIHAVVEAFVVFAFYRLSPVEHMTNIFFYLFVLVGIGGLIHSLIDFYLAKIVLDRMAL